MGRAWGDMGPARPLAMQDMWDGGVVVMWCVGGRGEGVCGLGVWWACDGGVGANGFGAHGCGVRKTGEVACGEMWRAA